ncbi:MAG: hypothetical protein JWP67_2233 [Mucilaginibacter sp.]|nr:hypothetical protein [Mucilaginibacter sp.]
MYQNGSVHSFRSFYRLLFFLKQVHKLMLTGVYDYYEYTFLPCRMCRICAEYALGLNDWLSIIVLY